MSGRIEGLKSSVILTQEDIENDPTAQRLRDKIETSTWKKSFRRGLTDYCNFVGMRPSDILKDRKETFKSDDEEIRRKHEELFDKFRAHLQTLHSQQNRKKKLSSATVAHALTAVNAFYHRNYYPLIEVEIPASYTERPLHIPSPEELGLMILNMKDPIHKVALVAAAQSGLGEAELLNVRWDMTSGEFGPVKRQLTSNPHGIIHIHMVRGKTHIPFDTYFGHETVRILKLEETPKDAETLFPMSIRSFEDAVRDVSEELKMEGETTPHAMRKFFTTRLKMARINSPAFNNDLVEYWTGHSLGRVRGSYFAPSVPEQVELYLEAEPRITPVYPPN